MRPIKATAIADRPDRSGLTLPLAFLLLVSALFLAGCNTVSGVGEDVSAAGEALDQTSERTQEKVFDDPNARSRDYQSGRY